MKRFGDTSPGRQGWLRAQEGFTLLELVFVTCLIAIIAAIAIPMYSSFIQKATETAAVAYLGKAKKAQELFRIESLSNAYSSDFDELETTGMIEPAVGAATRVAQEYQVTLAAAIVAGKPVWNITATPLSGSPTARHFYIDQTGVVRYNVGAAAGAGSPPFNP